MNKIYTLFLLLLIYSPFLHCDVTKVTNLNYWVPFSGGDARPMQLIVDTFNTQHPDINVKMKVIKWNEYYHSLDGSLLTKKSPDVAIVHASQLNRYVSSKSLIRLDEYNIDWDDFSDKLLMYIRDKNSNYAIPLDTHPQVFYFNKKYLREADLLDEKEQPIMKDGVDGFIDFFKTLKQKLPATIRPLSSANLNVYPFWIWYSLYMQQNNNGGYLNNNRASFNNEAGKNALEVLKKMRDANIWNEKIHDEKGYNLFKFNKSATMITGTWATWNFSQNDKLEFGVSTFPTLFDKASSFGDSHTLVLLKQKDKQKIDNSVRFIKWMSKNSYRWAISGQIPANKSITDSNRFLYLPNRKLYLKAADSLSFYPKNSKIKECNAVMIKEMVAFMHSNNSIENTLNRAEIKINKILEEKNGKD